MGYEQAGSAPLARAFRLLDEIVAAGTPLSVAELAERTEIPKPTVHRLVGNMIAEGLLRNDSFSRGLVPGARVIGMMVKAQAASWPGGPVRAVMQSLVDDVRESCNFGVFDRDAVLYVERVECEWPIRIQLGAGSRVPLHASAIGKLLWAHLPEPDRRHLLATLPRPALTANTVTDASALETQFDVIRREGHALNDAENVDGLIGLAVPVRLGSDPDRVVAGLSVHAPATRMDLDGARALLPRFEAAARQLSELLTPEVRT